MILRNVNDDDHEWLVELHNDPEVLRNLTNPNPVTLDQHLAWWNKISKDKSQLRLIFEANGIRAGFTKFYSIDPTNKNCVLGADIHISCRGKGLAKPMWNIMVDFCYSNLNLHRISLTTAEYNSIARKVYTDLGFKEEGRLKESLYRDGKFWDQICMYMLQSFRTL